MRGPYWTEILWAGNRIQVWSTALCQPPSIYAQCKDALAEIEIRRFEQYGDPDTADEFVVRRGTLRHLLSDFLGVAPTEILIDQSQGKPFLPNHMPEFSVSSSKDLALFAISASGPVGVDVEWIDAHFDFESVLNGSFSEREQKSLRGKAVEQFYEAWVRKEAAVKALGLGLSRSLADLEVMFADRVHSPGSPDLILRDFELPPGYRGALAHFR